MKLTDKRFWKFEAMMLLCAVLTFYDWKPASASVRPEDISEDEVKYITDNELVIIIGVGWTVLLVVPVLMASYLTKRWIVKKGV